MVWKLLLGALLVTVGVKCDISFGKNVSVTIKKSSAELDATTNSELSKKYSGTIGIVGGSVDFAGAVYFTAISALLTGADNVKVFCPYAAGNIIKAYSPDISVYPILDDINKTLEELKKVDVVVLGPGLDETLESEKNLKRVIKHCGIYRIPLVIDVTIFFIKNWDKNILWEYPKSGVILLPNKVEEQALSKNFNVATGVSNVYILRKGFEDKGYGSLQYYKWCLRGGNSARRSSGQGHMLTGAVATYFFLAMKKISQIPNTTNSTNSDEFIFKAAVATYTASKSIRTLNLNAYNEKERGMTTSDMVRMFKENTTKRSNNTAFFCV